MPDVNNFNNIELFNAAMEMVMKEHKWSREVEKTRRNKIVEKRE